MLPWCWSTVDSEIQIHLKNPGIGPGPFCFMSTEARLLIRDGDRGRGGRESEGLTVDTARKRPERLWTATRTMEVLSATSALRSCCFNCRAEQSHKDNVHCSAVEKQPEVKEVQFSQPSSTSLLMISSGLTWGSNSTSLLDLAWNPVCGCSPGMSQVLSLKPGVD